MRFQIIFYLLLFNLLFTNRVMAQIPNVNEKDKFNNTQINANRIDSILKSERVKKKVADNLNAAEVVDCTNVKKEEGNGIRFNLFEREKAVVSEDELSIDMGVPQIVKATEEIRIGEDSAWVKVADYYAIWDSQYINPYNKNPEKFNEVVNIQLYNPDKGTFWASPLYPSLVTSLFGFRWGRFHPGMDLNLDLGQPVFATFDGIVRISGYDSGYGNYVVIRHFNGLETLYGHLSMRKVDSKQYVKAGQLIGLGGSTGWSTGPHLHLEVRYEGNSINPSLIFDFADPKNPQLRSQYFTLMPQHFNHLGNQINTIIYHQVSMGETLESISKKYNVPIEMLSEINGLERATELRIGQRLKIR